MVDPTNGAPLNLQGQGLVDLADPAFAEFLGKIVTNVLGAQAAPPPFDEARLTAMEEANAHLVAQSQLARVERETTDKFNAVGIALGPNPLPSSVRRLHEYRFALGPFLQAQMIMGRVTDPSPEDIANLINTGTRGLSLILGSLVVASTQSSAEVGNAYFDSLYREAAARSDLAVNTDFTEPQLVFVTRAVDAVKGRKRPFDNGGRGGWTTGRFVPQFLLNCYHGCSNLYRFCLCTLERTLDHVLTLPHCVPMMKCTIHVTHWIPYTPMLAALIVEFHLARLC
jgi:hypothetical protein